MVKAFALIFYRGIAVPIMRASWHTDAAIKKVAMKPSRLLERLSRGAIRNVGFHDVQQLVEALGFRLARLMVAIISMLTLTSRS
ncbi:MAG: hypothetical protein U1E35_01930 [Rhodospirillales bacterium]